MTGKAIAFDTEIGVSCGAAHHWSYTVSELYSENKLEALAFFDFRVVCVLGKSGVANPSASFLKFVRSLQGKAHKSWKLASLHPDCLIYTRFHFVAQAVFSLLRC